MEFLGSFRDYFSNVEIEKVIEDAKGRVNRGSCEADFLNQSKKEEKSISKNLFPIQIAKILKKQLPKYIYGQDHVIERIVDYFKNNIFRWRKH